MLRLEIPFPFAAPDAAIAFSIGPLPVRWYGLAYLAGIVLGWLYARRLIAQERLWGPAGPPATREQLDDFIFWATIGIVVGGRLGSVLFYDPLKYVADPIKVLKIWEGGMSFHGGLLGVVVVALVFSARNGLARLSFLDLLAAVAPIGLFFGRLANFVNGELWGRTTDLPWAMAFPAAGPEPRHPSQLYEAGLEGVALFLLLWLMTHRFRAFHRPGLTAGVFLVGYAAARLLVETVREPDVGIGFVLGPLTMGMLLSLPMLIAGIVVILLVRQRHATA